MAGAALVGTLLIDIATDVAQLKRGFNEARGVVTSFGDAITQLGAKIRSVALPALAIVAMTKALAELVQGFDQAADRATKLAQNAQQLGLGTDALQAYSKALKEIGVEGSRIQSTLGSGASFFGRALTGGKEQIDTLNQLGVKILDAKGNFIGYDQALSDTARKISELKNPTEQLGYATKIFGENAKTVVPALQALGEGSAQLQSKLRDVVPAETIANFKRFNDERERLGQRVETITTNFFGSLITPEVVEEAEKLSRSFDRLLDTWTGLGKVIQPVVSILTGGFLTGLRWIIDALEDIGAYFLRLPMRVADAVGAVQEYLQRFKIWIEEHLTLFDDEQTRKNVDAAKAGLSEIQAARREQQTRLANDILTSQGLRPPPLVINVTPGRGNPAARGGGSTRDVFAERMAALKDQQEALRTGMRELEQASSLPSKEMERQAKLLIDIAQKQAAATKGITDPAKKAALEAEVQTTEKLRYQYETLKQVIATADEVRSKYGDGTRELADRVYYLNAAFAAGKINVAEYAAALEEARRTQAIQAEEAKGRQGGIDAIAAGWRAASIAASDSMAEFKMGQQLFTNSFQLMSKSISDFVTTGQIDFQNLAASFASMLADMAIKWAATSIFREISGMSGGGGRTADQIMGLEAADSVGFLSRAFSWFSGMFADGGVALTGRSYTVGERGPETFTPSVPGVVSPNQGGRGDITVNVDMGTAMGGRGTDPQNALDFGRKIKAAVVDVIHQEQRPGGTLYAR